MLTDALAQAEARWLALSATSPEALAQHLAADLVRPFFGAQAHRVVCEPPAQAPVPDVVALIQVASRLDEASMAAAVQRARQLKAERGAAAPRLAVHLLALDGPTRMVDAHGLLKKTYADHGIVDADLPPTGEERLVVPSPGLDGVFVPGRGFLNFDNVPIGFLSDEARMTLPGLTWAICQTERGALMSLALQLHQAGLAWADPATDLAGALAGFSVPNLRFGN